MKIYPSGKESNLNRNIEVKALKSENVVSRLIQWNPNTML